MTIYLSGPMSWYPGDNRELFKEVEKLLLAIMESVTVMNPTTFPPLQSTPDDSYGEWWAYVQRDLNVIREKRPDMILMLPGWDNSAGALMEYIFAKRLNIPCSELADFIHDQIRKEVKS